MPGGSVISGVRLSRWLLASASLATLSIAGLGRASAAGTTVTVTGNAAYTVPTNEGWIDVDSSLISTFTNNQTIADGFGNPDGIGALALHIRGNSTISQLINGAAGQITAIEGTATTNNLSTEKAVATAVFIEGIVPSVVNNGTIRAVAFAHDTNPFGADATAFAGGYHFVAGSAASQFNDLTNNGKILAQATAKANATYSSVAHAKARAIGGSQSASNSGAAGGESLLSAENSGTIRVGATALAVGATYAVAVASAQARGLGQIVSNAAKASGILNNTGSIIAIANAHAVASGTYLAHANASATGVDQRIGAAGTAADARAFVSNSKLIQAIAKAHAQATYNATATAAAIGVLQIVKTAGVSGKALAQLTNTGNITAEATATADPRGFTGGIGAGAGRLRHAHATIESVTGVAQSVSGNNATGSSASAMLTNRGSILVTGKANAISGSASYAFAQATVAHVIGVFQSAESASTAAVDMTNFGSILVSGEARALAASGSYAQALDPAIGVSQKAFGLGSSGSATAGLTNNGIVHVTAVALATAMHPLLSLTDVARATAIGVRQEVGQAVNGLDSLVNSGSIAAVANATVKGRRALGAAAAATGVKQVLDASLTGSATARLRNDKGGGISAQAIAKAVGIVPGLGIASASARAVGVDIQSRLGSPSVPITLDVVNSGLIKAVATAGASGSAAISRARAIARGILVSTGGTLAGSIMNNGTIQASAFANGKGSVSADAIGILDPSSGNNSHITNDGSIKAYAQGVTAHATDIGIAGTGVAGPPGFKTVITNDGNLWAGISTDGGKTIHWGNAINTVDAGGQGPAPNPVLIQLIDARAPSNIFGNIVINPADKILVEKGETKLGGLINPSMALVGTLDINAAGKLFLQAGDPVNGASGAWIQTFALHPGGRLAIELTADNNPAITPKLHYPHINASSVSLNGGLFVDFLPAKYNFTRRVYEDVIHAATPIVGNFNRVLPDSALLNVKAVKENEAGEGDTGYAVDLDVTRLAFSAVPGLSANQQSVGAALDKLSGTNTVGGIVPQLFSLNNAEYAKALNALGGAEFAQLDQSVLWSTGQLNSTITDRMDCGANWAASANGGGRRTSAASCRARPTSGRGSMARGTRIAAIRTRPATTRARWAFMAAPTLR